MASFTSRINDLDSADKILEVFNNLQDKQTSLNKRLDALQKRLMEVDDNTEAILEVYETLEAREDALGDRIDQLGQAILETFPTKDEGSETTSYGDFKVKTTGRKYRKVDTDTYEDIKDELPKAARKAFKTKYKVSKSTLNDLKKVDPDAHEKAMKAVSISKGSDGLKVERNDG